MDPAHQSGLKQRKQQQQQQQHRDRQQTLVPPEQLQAYQRKWDEEMEGFRKLAARLGQPGGGQAGGVQATGSTEAQQQVHQLPDTIAGSSAVEQRSPQCRTTHSALAAAVTQAEALLAEVHAAAVQSLSCGSAADNKLLAKQLRLQRNKAFDAAKALLHKAASSC